MNLMEILILWINLNIDKQFDSKYGPYIILKEAGRDN